MKDIYINNNLINAEDVIYLDEQNGKFKIEVVFENSSKKEYIISILRKNKENDISFIINNITHDLVAFCSGCSLFKNNNENDKYKFIFIDGQSAMNFIKKLN